MFKKRLIKASGATAALLLVASTAAMAGPPTYITVNGVGGPSALADVNGANAGTIEFSTDFGVPVSCSTSALTAKSYRGSLVVAGMPIGRISTLTGTCSVNYGSPTTTAKIGSDWSIDVKVTPASAGASVAVEILNMRITIGSGGCHFRAEAGVNPVNATLIPGPVGGHDAQLDIDTGLNYPLDITALNSSGVPTTHTCAGQIYTGDDLSMEGIYDLDTTGAITGSISHG